LSTSSSEEDKSHLSIIDAEIVALIESSKKEVGDWVAQESFLKQEETLLQEEL
jgi:hypothetical protein